MNIFAMIALGIGGLFSISVLLYLFLGIPAVLIWKIYRKVKFGYSIWD